MPLCNRTMNKRICISHITIIPLLSVFPWLATCPWDVFGAQPVLSFSTPGSSVTTSDPRAPESVSSSQENVAISKRLVSARVFLSKKSQWALPTHEILWNSLFCKGFPKTVNLIARCFLASNVSILPWCIHGYSMIFMGPCNPWAQAKSWDGILARQAFSLRSPWEVSSSPCNHCFSCNNQSVRHSWGFHTSIQLQHTCFGHLLRDNSRLCTYKMQIFFLQYLWRSGSGCILEPSSSWWPKLLQSYLFLVQRCKMDGTARDCQNE